MSHNSSRFGGLVAWGTFLTLFGLLAVGALIGVSRLIGYVWKWLG